MFLPDGSEYLCTECKNGFLVFFDYVKRIVRDEAGEAEWIFIPRHKCNNERCQRIHRMLPDILTPFKHYKESVISDAIDDKIIPKESDDRPSEATVKRWKHWMILNELDIEGYLRSIGYRELGFSEELLKTSFSLLEKIHSSMPNDWLKIIIRMIYNSGGRLCPFYD